MARQKPKKSPSQYGKGQPVDEKIVLEGMKSVQNEQVSEAEQSQGSFAEQLVIGEKIREVLRQSGLDPKTVTSDVRSLEDRARNVILDTRSDIKFSKVSPFSYYGSIGATRVPPFDYQWSWEWDLNSPSIKKSCSSAKGEMGFSLWGNESIPSSGSAQTAIGIYFMPPSRNGHLLTSASPGFRSFWGTWCALASAHTDGYIGLLVVSYNTSDNSYASTIINQRITLFSDDSWFHGIGLQQSSNSGYPLSAMFPVDNAHWYAIWIVSSGHIDAAGYDPFSGSGAHSSIGTGISSMSWMYFG